MVTTKKISSEFTQKEMRRKSNHVTPKKVSETQRRKRGLRYKKATNLAETNKKIAICPSLVIISNAINGLNPPIRRLRMAE